LKTLEVDNISCIKGDHELFSSFSYSFLSGHSYHVVGENGAGKTSFLKILCGIARPDSGRITWSELDIHQNIEHYLPDLLYIGHKNAVKSELTVIENLSFSSNLHVSKINTELLNVIDQCELSGYENVPCKYLSLGQTRRVAIARLFIESASIWLLDEPINGLDIKGVALFIQLVNKHTGNGGIVVFTSHQLLDLKNQHQIRLV